MSENKFNLADLLMEKLQCSICKGYLSCSPVRLLPDGSSICGQCSPPSNDSPIYRERALEAILERVSFPCGFAKHGCKTRLVFGQTAEHELKCEYRSFSCPFQDTACCWKGSISKMLHHFTEAHPEQVLENVDFKLEVNEDSAGVILVPKRSILFVIKYQYKAEDSHLTYDIRFCKNDSILGASYKFQLINNSDREYTIGLKTVDCLIYDDTFYGVENAAVFNLNKYLDNLDNPSCILINVNLTIYYNEEDESGDDDSSPTSANIKNNVKKASLTGIKISATNFLIGGFLILKKDAQSGDSSKPLWRIDGKSLLQKYEAFEKEGQVRHRNTAIYTGWSSLDKELYHPVAVKVLKHRGQNMTVELNWEKLKELNNESE